MRARRLSILMMALAAALPAFATTPTPIPTRFDSEGDERRAIQALLDTYTKAVSNKDQALFETLLLNKAIPFSATNGATAAGSAERGTQNYEGFRKSVFEGPPFTQTFRDIRIQHYGPLADVSLVFVNRTPRGSDWGWKTMQLLKVDGTWKIASEFFTFPAG